MGKRWDGTPACIAHWQTIISSAVNYPHPKEGLKHIVRSPLPSSTLQGTQMCLLPEAMSFVLLWQGILAISSRETLVYTWSGCPTRIPAHWSPTHSSLQYSTPQTAMVSSSQQHHHTRELYSIPSCRYDIRLKFENSLCHKIELTCCNEEDIVGIKCH